MKKTKIRGKNKVIKMGQKNVNLMRDPHDKREIGNNKSGKGVFFGRSPSKKDASAKKPMVDMSSRGIRKVLNKQAEKMFGR